MVRLVRCLAVFAVAVGLVAGNAAICAGWMPTAQARMACCTAGRTCPMHSADSHKAGSGQVLTQAQADSCCAAAQGRDSSPSSQPTATGITIAVLGVPVVLPASVPALVVSDGWRRSAPLRPPPVPKHVLLSVFLL